ncbi:MAG: molybdopterin molybdotransferase MoeA [Chloroflexota bacterium]|nr:MAG: molybdopterin molybdotransferase MoeA [Chloroflexota bacterium]
MLSVSDALSRLLSNFSSVGMESVSLKEAAGRVLSEEIHSTIDLPLFTNSSMDGFALRAEDVEEANPANPITLTIVEDIPAGKGPEIEISKYQAARIMTGAPIPDGADAVIPIEDTDQYDPISRVDPALPKKINVHRSVKTGDYVRRRGEDVAIDEVVLKSQSRLRPQDLGLLAMLGIPEIPVYRLPRIVILSTGDELVPVEEQLQFGKIHDSNAYTLSALIFRDGGLPVYLGIVPDQEQAVRDFLVKALENNADLILSSAGVSVGAFDFVRSVVQSDGNLDFWKVNMRPGKPLAFGDYQGVPFIGLPGNPVSAFVGYEVFVRPAIMRLAGLRDALRDRTKVKLTEDIISDGRESYLRAIVTIENGEAVARLTGHQGSGNLLSLVQANSLLILPAGSKSLSTGSYVDAWLLDDA